MNTRIELHRGDLTAFAADALVNAANSSLLGGGGVDGAIHRVGGPAILDACRRLRATELPDGLPAGHAVATTAGRLSARWVIHTVGPVHTPRENRETTLASCYRESLRVADEVGAATIAFPAIGAGVYGWPMADAARVAVETVAAALGNGTTQVRLVTFVLFSDEALAAFRKALDALERSATS